MSQSSHIINTDNVADHAIDSHSIHPVDTLHSEPKHIDISPVNTSQADANDIDLAEASSKHIRIVNTFMKRRTHMNKHAEQALTDPQFAEYLVNNSYGDGNLDDYLFCQKL